MYNAVKIKLNWLEKVLKDSVQVPLVAENMTVHSL